MGTLQYQCWTYSFSSGELVLASDGIKIQLDLLLPLFKNFFPFFLWSVSAPAWLRGSRPQTLKLLSNFRNWIGPFRPLFDVCRPWEKQQCVILQFLLDGHMTPVKEITVWPSWTFIMSFCAHMRKLDSVWMRVGEPAVSSAACKWEIHFLRSHVENHFTSAHLGN